MQLNFNLEDILYLNMSDIAGKFTDIKLALKEKTESDIIAIAKTAEVDNITAKQMITLGIVCHDGLYKTKTELKEIINEGEFTKFIIDNPKTLDYQQNRNHYRILAEHDCIYTVETEHGTESYNAVTYDISAGGVSIIIDENVVSKDEMSILIFINDKNIKSHLKFVRCELFEEDNYKLSFRFMDLSENDTKYLSELCTYKQLS